jgi:hypothetical protein
MGTLLLLSLGCSTRLLWLWFLLLSLLWLSFVPSLSKADLLWLWFSCQWDVDLVGSLEWVLLLCSLKAIDRGTSLSRSCSSLGWEIASSSSASSLILSYGEFFALLVAYLSSASCSDFFLSYSARSDQILSRLLCVALRGVCDLLSTYSSFPWHVSGF